MKFNFINMPIPLYGLFIILSLVLSSLFIIIDLKKKKISNQTIFLSLFMTLYFIIVFSLSFTQIINYIKYSTLSFGLSSYGGAIGLLLSILIFNIINKKNNENIAETYIISLPLFYSISKLGCFFSGCCHGIIYNGIFSVIYKTDENFVSYFPIQLLESIVFLLIFIYVKYLSDKNKNYIVYITIILSAIAKFLFDYLRFSHINQFLSINQIVSIFFIILSLICILKKKSKIKTNTYLKKEFK